MQPDKKPTGKEVHDMCHNPCLICQKTGSLDNKADCSACGGTGCRDKTHCAPARGLACEP